MITLREQIEKELAAMEDEGVIIGFRVPLQEITIRLVKVVATWGNDTKREKE